MVEDEDSVSSKSGQFGPRKSNMNVNEQQNLARAKPKMAHGKSIIDKSKTKDRKKGSDSGESKLTPEEKLKVEQDQLELAAKKVAKKKARKLKQELHHKKKLKLRKKAEAEGGQTPQKPSEPPASPNPGGFWASLLAPKQETVAATYDALKPDQEINTNRPRERKSSKIKTKYELNISAPIKAAKAKPPKKQTESDLSIDPEEVGSD